MGLEQEVAQGRAEARWGSCAVFQGGYKEPRPKPCLVCKGRYRGLTVIVLGRNAGICTLQHGVFRWPARA